ncbi:flagellar hook-length control protein FliK [Malikia spinosa]|uniref:Flagellar hook-length control protein FliK n=1 Tax=Malikia spinosa TaxID=86180 RepID=A0A7C9IZ10_9BURK|nr:flagellar hook-length control protein FliK [Malikia spinosa]MYZ52887.1 flagellar hook-length control protein FliK [Malikia spinosa]
MLPRLDLAAAAQVTAVSTLRATTVVADPRQDGAARLEQVEIGRTLQGKVQAALSDGSALVRFGSEAPPARPLELRLQLPAGFAVGDTLALTLLAREPRLTFGLQGQNGSVQTHFSAAGELIGRLLQPEAGQPARPLQGSAPLQATPGAGVAQLTQNLQQSLEGSGLFYESHLEQWSRGERTLDQIRQEPQNRPGGDALAAQLLPQQLDTLEQRRLVWQGELWPGQPMEWELVQEKDQQQQPREPGQPAAWETVLKLELPQLGQVNATIRLQGEQAQVRLRVLDEAAAAALQADQGRLDDALAAAGTVLGGFLVQRDALPPDAVESGAIPNEPQA